jgi:hypothetical protein
LLIGTALVLCAFAMADAGEITLNLLLTALAAFALGAIALASTFQRAVQSRLVMARVSGRRQCEDPDETPMQFNAALDAPGHAHGDGGIARATAPSERIEATNTKTEGKTCLQ